MFFRKSIIIFTMTALLAASALSCTRNISPSISLSGSEAGSSLLQSGTPSNDSTEETSPMSTTDSSNASDPSDSGPATSTGSAGSSSSAGNSSSTAASASSSNTGEPKTINVDIAEFEEYGDDYLVLSQAIKTVSMRSSMSIMNKENVEYRLVLKKKTYRIDQTLVLTGTSNIEIDGQGASLIFTKAVSALYMSECQNVSFTNMTVDYDPLVCTQGIVQKITDSKVQVKIDDGYPTDISFLNNTKGNDGLIWSTVHDKTTGGVLPGAPHSYAYSTNARSLGGRDIEFTQVFVSTSKGRQLQVGDLISLFHRGPSTVVTGNCSRLSFTNFNVYASPGFGFSISGGGDGASIFNNVDIIPGPKPAGATQNRVRSVNADGMHFGNVKDGPQIINCTITHTGDDCVNIQGFFFHILSVSGNTLIVTPKWNTPLKVGETIEGYKDDGYGSVGTAKIVKFTARNDSSRTTEIRKAYLNYDHTIGDDTLIYEITLDKKLSLVKGDHITSLDRLGSGAIIRNSKFGYNRARGVVVKGQDILVEGNTFIGSHLPAIVAHADIYWCESGFPVNLIIRNNTITSMVLSSDVIQSDRIDQIGAILVTVTPPTNVTGFYNNHQNRNILIEGNKITNTQVYGIFAVNCDTLTIRNNTITNPFMNGFGNVGNLYPITPDSGIFVGMSSNVTVTGNTVIQGNTVLANAVTIHPNCTGTIKNSGNLLK
ncbi:MAG: right-handed parallel beta-helix repeat-containing protein [Saccharofermentanales bacterium]